MILNSIMKQFSLNGCESKNRLLSNKPNQIAIRTCQKIILAWVYVASMFDKPHGVLVVWILL